MALIDKVLNETKTQLSSIPASIVTMEIYDEEMGIIENSSRYDGPMALVSMHEPEDLTLIDPFTIELERYAAVGVLKHTGMAFDVLQRLPRHRVEEILQHCEKMTERETRETDKAMQPIRNGGGTRLNGLPRRK